MPSRKCFSEEFLILVAICLLLGGIVYQTMEVQQDTLSLLQQVLPEASFYENVGGKYPAYRVFDDNQNLLGYGAMAEGSGYGGPIKVFTVINPEGVIINAIIIENRETPLYLQRVMEHDFLDQFMGKSVSASLSLSDDLDGISGATISSAGIASAVRKGTYQIGIQELCMEKKKAEKVKFGWRETVLIALFSVTILSIKRKLVKLRPFILLFSVFFLGFRLNASVNLGNIASLISGNAPSFLERPFWFLLVVGTLLLVLMAGKNFYCTWLCPFGAVQEGIHKALCLMKYNIPKKVLAHAGTIRLTLTWIALMFAFLSANPSIAGYEPFSAFFSGSANGGQWLIMSFVLFMSIFINRPWCRLFCPTGAVMDMVASTRRSIVKLICPVQRRQIGMDTFDSAVEEKGTVFISILTVFIALIIFTLFMNAGVL